MAERRARWPWWAAALLALVAALAVRLSYDVNRSTAGGEAAWVSLDPDTLYHARRVQRALTEEGPPAGTDPWLDHPDGAEIPWPPYATALLAGVVTAAHGADATPLEVEQTVASVPVVLGVLTVLVALLAARRLGGDAAGAFAGTTAALALGSVVYSSLGNGDHHALVALLHALLLAGLSELLARGVLEDRRLAAAWGLALGAILGIALGVWVAFLTYLLEVELVLALLLVGHARRPLAGLAPFGLALHASALLALWPAVADSPWQEAQPWSVVNLSHFHAAFLAVGGAVFVPLLVPGLGERLRPRHPWVVGVALVALATWLLASEVAAGAGLREAFAWLSREDSFMASIQESRALLDDPLEGVRHLNLALGLGWLLLLPALALGFRELLRGRRALLPWMVAAPLLLLQATSQLRFAEGLVVPLAVVLGWALAHILDGRLGLVRGRGAGAVLGAAALALLLQLPAVAETARYLGARSRRPEPTELQQRLGAVRRACDWLRARGEQPGAETVLAGWGEGHPIEWAAARPTVATNFGGYLGEESYRYPPRAFLTEEPLALEALLAERRVGHLLLTSRLTEGLPDLAARAGAEPERYLLLRDGRWRGGLRPPFFRTALGRLLVAGSEFTGDLPDFARRAPGFLRLVHIAPELDPAPHLGEAVERMPRAWVWERVEGARVVLRGAPGAPYELRVELTYPDTEQGVVFEREGVLGPEGVHLLRVPYATDAANGDGVARSGAELRIAGVARTLVVPEEAVRTGAEVLVD